MKKDVIIGIIVGIILIVGITIGIVNPGNIESIKNNENSESNENVRNTENAVITNEIATENTSPEEMAKEEKTWSMESGEKLCVIGNTAIWYDGENKNLHITDLTTNESKKVENVNADKIYFDGTNIFYIPPYYNSEKGIYKIDLAGTTTKISDNTSLQLCITDDKVYFVNQIGYDEINGNPQGEIWYMDKDGKNATKIADSIKNYFYIENEKIYYTSQDRKMYQANLDGTEQTELTTGRKFPLAVKGNYLIYIDYGDQESKHILNLETKDDKTVGYFGTVRKYNGNIYINCRERLDDGSIDIKSTLSVLTDDGKVAELCKLDDLNLLEYVTKNKAFVSDGDGKVYTVDFYSDNEKHYTSDYENCKYFVGGYGYEVDTSSETISRILL